MNSPDFALAVPYRLGAGVVLASLRMFARLRTQLHFGLLALPLVRIGFDLLSAPNHVSAVPAGAWGLGIAALVCWLVAEKFVQSALLLSARPVVVQVSGALFATMLSLIFWEVAALHAHFGPALLVPVTCLALATSPLLPLLPMWVSVDSSGGGPSAHERTVLTTILMDKLAASLAHAQIDLSLTSRRSVSEQEGLEPATQLDSTSRALRTVQALVPALSDDQLQDVTGHVVAVQEALNVGAMDTSEFAGFVACAASLQSAFSSEEVLASRAVPLVEVDGPPRFLAHHAVGLIRAYRSFYGEGLRTSCCYWPTCSVYAERAILRHGVWRGGKLAATRILRCNPRSRGGIDPVPG